MDEAVLAQHGLAVFEGRIVYEAQPPVSQRELARIAARLSGPIPDGLLALWQVCYGGRLDYDLVARLGDRTVPVSLRELFYPGSDGYHDLDGWMDHELELATDAAYEAELEPPRRLDFLPFGGFEYLERVYVVVRPGPEHGSVVYYRQGLPPAWDDPGGVTRLAADVRGLFAQLVLHEDPRSPAPGSYASGTEVLDAVRRVPEPTRSALEALLVSACPS